jgi:uncharacterized membrane protein
MHQPMRLRLGRTPVLLACILILKVTIEIVGNYRNYFPPSFSSDFLRGRQDYFFGAYRWAFYVHILSAPVSLLLGLLLLGERSRARFPSWHRTLGRVQVVCVLLLVAPSGLVMAWYAEAGPIASAGLALLAIAIAGSVATGTRAAMQGRFLSHRRWMLRGFLLLCSAVVLRLMGGLASVAGVTAPWFDSLSAWICWLGPLAVFENVEAIRRGSARRTTHPAQMISLSDRARRASVMTLGHALRSR